MVIMWYVCIKILSIKNSRFCGFSTRKKFMRERVKGEDEAENREDSIKAEAIHIYLFPFVLSHLK